MAPWCKETQICSDRGSPSLLRQRSLGSCQLHVIFITLSFLLVDVQWRESHSIWPCQVGHRCLKQALLSQKPEERLPFTRVCALECLLILSFPIPRLKARGYLSTGLKPFPSSPVSIPHFTLQKRPEFLHADEAMCCVLRWVDKAPLSEMCLSVKDRRKQSCV